MEPIQKRIQNYRLKFLSNNPERIGPKKLFLSCNLIEELMRHIKFSMLSEIDVWDTEYLKFMKHFKMSYMGMEVVRIIEDDYIFVQ